MKVLHTSDWHIGQFKGPVVDGVNLRSHDTVKCLDFMIEKAREEEPDLICVSGDIFHQEQIGPVRYSDEMVTAARVIEQLAETTKLVVVMRGTPNHDGSGQFKVLEKMMQHNKKVVVVSKPQVLQTPIADIACIPGFDKQEFRSRFPGLSADEENEVWTQQISNLVLGLRAQCAADKPSILMAHYTVPGCNMESGQASFFANFEPVIPREALQAAHYEAVLLGHIHRPQMIDGLHNVFYAGAINALNFNDEEQERGFWIHEFNEHGALVRGHRYTTPYRKFHTVNWDSDNVEHYIREGNMYLYSESIPFDVNDAIVRVKYSCTSKQKKQLNIPLLQKDLYEAGAFYVADIEAESTVDITNRGLLSEESDPKINLKKWLEEKCFKDPDKIIELAEPIIAEAMKQSSTSEVHGVFRPVSITVRNYRNYKEESFDFSDISFCTINGVNGAGKSSLFMDAIVDCLFEETREGDNKAWIRGTEDARSGSIEFIFDIGDQRFRVVRTRTKSGKPTLNLSQMKEDCWTNLSKERIADTQAEIEKLLGMDSVTFKSCALIMQDQYGLFLQAKKDERMAILGNLLGLGIYGIMELDAKKRLSESKKELASKKEAVRNKTDFIKSKGNPEAELEDVEEDILRTGKSIENLKNTRMALVERQEKIDKAEQERQKVRNEITECKDKRKVIQQDISSSQQSLEACNMALASADRIREKAEEYRKLMEHVSELENDVLRYKNEKAVLSGYDQEILRISNIIDTTRRRNEQIAIQISQLSSELPEDIEEILAELSQVKTELEDQKDRKYRASILEQELSQIMAQYSEKIDKLETKKKVTEDRISSIRQQEEFMRDSGCPDIENASCKFLAKAIEDSKMLPDVEKDLQSITDDIETYITERQSIEAEKKNEIHDIGYSEEIMNTLESRARELGKYEQIKEASYKNKLEIARLETEKETNDKTIGQYEENLSEVKIKAQRVTYAVDTLSDSVDKYDKVKRECELLESFSEQEKQLPVYEERAHHISERLYGLQEDLEKCNEAELILCSNLLGMDKLLEKLREEQTGDSINELDKKISDAEKNRSDAQIKKGILLQRIEDIETMQGEISMLNKGIAVAAGKADGYEALKQAFSQDGVPHQIIRNIIPHITDTSNNILGSMTGGTMGVEFVMERTVKGKDGDKATLDVLINEFGKTTLPYASKSGGEKVKASLAVILALAEIKTTAAGIQLGMLFIDEAPFLDSDGTQAYCDALETIQHRYPDTKIMAITHDDEFKSRFPQSVTVIKTEDGSKVVY